MARRPSPLTQKALTGYAKSMQAAGVAEWSIDVAAPDGTLIRITAGAPQGARVGSTIDKLLGIHDG